MHTSMLLLCLLDAVRCVPAKNPNKGGVLEQEGEGSKNEKTGPQFLQPYGAGDVVKIQQPNNVYFTRRFEEQGLETKKIPFESVLYYDSGDSFPTGAAPKPVEVRALEKLASRNNNFTSQLQSYTQDVDSKMHQLIMRAPVGHPLQKYLTEIVKEPLPRSAFKYIAFQLILAQLLMLQKRIVHGDFCAENTFIDPTTLRIMITEFGAAQIGNPLPIGDPGFSLAHVAPERCSLKKAVSGEASEVFSLGVLFYQLLHRGKSPFIDGSTKLDKSADIEFTCAPGVCDQETTNSIKLMLSYFPDKRPRLETLKDSEWLAEGKEMFANSFYQLSFS